jgi:hypothetical protein
MVQLTVFRIGHDKQVLRSIVGLVAVDMVNVLVIG